MIKIYANQLNTKLEQDNSWRYFLTVGNDPYLQDIAQTKITETLRLRGFSEQTVFIIDNQTNWDSIYENSRSMSLFSNLTLIILQFSDHSLNASTAKKLDELSKSISPDVSLLICLPQMTKSQESAHWVKTLSDHLLIISCNTPDINQLPNWINQQLQNHDLTIEKQGIELLCYFYEGNLLALSQMIEQLKLLYPDGKISYSQLESNLEDCAIFTPFHLIDAMLMSKAKRVVHILQQLKTNDTVPLILLRTIQRELIQLINLKKDAAKSNLKVAYDNYKVWQNRRNIITPYLNKTSLEQLYKNLNILTELEIALKSDYEAPIWENLTSLCLQF